jgi:hypothetical protein
MCVSKHGFAVKIYAREEFSPPKLGFLTKFFTSVNRPGDKIRICAVFYGGGDDDNNTHVLSSSSPGFELSSQTQ